MTVQAQPTYRRRTAAELKNRPTRDLLKDVHKLRGRMLRGELGPDELAQAREDERLIERELRGRTRGKGE